MTLIPPTGAGFILAMATPPGQGGSVWIQFIPFALVLGIFYFLILRPMQTRQKKVEAFLAGLKTGDRVVTSGGLYGSVAKVGDDTAHLQIAANVRVEVSRSAIVGYQGMPPVADGSGAQ